MHPLEYVLLPSVLDPFHLDSVSELIALRNVPKLDADIDRASPFERNGAVRELRPIFELPLHLDFLVLFKGHVFSLDRVAEDLVLSSDFKFRDARRLSELAELHLISECFVDDISRTVVCDFDFSFLYHFVVKF